MAGKDGKGWLREIKQFYIAHNSDRISANAQALWHYLMYKANENWWNYPLCLYIPEIAFALKISQTAVKRAREELAAKGYITWESPGGNKSARYYVLSRTNAIYAGQTGTKEN